MPIVTIDFPMTYCQKNKRKDTDVELQVAAENFTSLQLADKGTWFYSYFVARRILRSLSHDVCVLAPYTQNL